MAVVSSVNYGVIASENKEKTGYIAVTDSGVGGLAVLKKLKNDFNDLNFLYVSDCACVPYGNKSKKQIIALCKKNIKTAFLNGAVAIVVACNTMSRVGKEAFLKCGAPCFFVEPNYEVLSAADKNYRNCAVFCTEATAADKMLKSLKNNLKCSVFPQKNLAKQIESRLSERCVKNDKPLKEKSLKNDGYEKNVGNEKYVINYGDDYDIDFSDCDADFCAKNFKTVFLSCTHYIHIGHIFEEKFKNAKIYDGTEKLKSEISEFLKNAGKSSFAKSLRGGKIKFAGSGKTKMKRVFLWLCNKKTTENR